jgi:hypothetical protein
MAILIGEILTGITMENEMKKMILPFTASIIFVGFSSNVVAENMNIPLYVEQDLVSICKVAAQDKVRKMNQLIKGIRLNHKLVALKVVCNGKDIISFAEHFGAKNTTAKLSRNIGNVKVTDLAFIDHGKYHVTFDY